MNEISELASSIAWEDALKKLPIIGRWAKMAPEMSGATNAGSLAAMLKGATAHHGMGTRSNTWYTLTDGESQKKRSIIRPCTPRNAPWGKRHLLNFAFTYEMFDEEEDEDYEALTYTGFILVTGGNTAHFMSTDGGQIGVMKRKTGDHSGDMRWACLEPGTLWGMNEVAPKGLMTKQAR